MSAKIISINRAMQFKVALDHIKPVIWRRIIVPFDYSFWDLHCAIQDSMGWDNNHLFSFELTDPVTNNIVEIGPPGEEFMEFSSDVLPDHKEKISSYFNESNKNASYEYDYGDSWRHSVKYEKTVVVKAGEKYPVCIAGKRACPPEDIGGIGGYYDLLSFLKNKKGNGRKEMIDWLGYEFDPEYFNPDDVIFDNPKKLLKLRKKGIS